MSDLPGSWITAALQDIIPNPRQNIVDGPFGSNLKASEYELSGIPIIRLQNVSRNRFLERNIKFITRAKADTLQRHNFVAGDIVITKLGDPLGKAAIIPPSLPTGVVVADIVRVRVDREYAEPRYLTYAINSQAVAEKLAEQTKGTTRPRVNLGHIRSLQIPVAPRNEQQRVADKLDILLASVGASLERLDRVPAMVKRLRQTILASATSGTLTAEWRARGDRAAEWRRQHLAELTTKVGSGATPRGGEDAYKKEGVPLIRSMNVVFFGFKREGMAFLDPEQAHDLRNVEVRARDVLLNITGASIGRVTLAPVDLHGARVNQHVCIIRPNANLLPEFLCWFLSAPAMQSVIGAENYGVTRQALTKRQILDFEIPVPPVDEQEEIVRRVETLFAYAMRLEARYTAAREQVERLTPALLSKAFRGELTPQDPNDEPAAVLLERIRSARPASSIEPRVGRAIVDESEVPAFMNDLIDVLTAAADWLPADEAFRRCGVANGAGTDRIERIYAELRALDRAGKLAIESVRDAQGRKLYDRLKLKERV